jgi:hypothetical protein
MVLGQAGRGRADIEHLLAGRWTVVRTLEAGPGSMASVVGRRSWLISLNRQM